MSIQSGDLPGTELSDGHFKIHYYLEDSSHQMDAVVRNKCEAEALALIQEVGRQLGTPFAVETKAYGEGGLEEYLVFIGAHAEAIKLIAQVLGAVLTTAAAAPFAIQRWQKGQVDLDKTRAELRRMNQEAAQEVEAPKPENPELPLEPKLTPMEISEALLLVKKVRLRRSKFYDLLGTEAKVTAVGFAPRHARAVPERVVEREAFARFVLHPEDLEPSLYQNVELEVVSPVLRTGNHNWRGIFERRGISFEMADREFKRRVIDQEVQFQNGTKMLCDLEVHLRDNEVGDPEVTKRIVTKVHSLRHVPKINPDAQGKLDLEEPDRSSTKDPE